MQGGRHVKFQKDMVNIEKVAAYFSSDMDLATEENFLNDGDAKKMFYAEGLEEVNQQGGLVPPERRSVMDVYKNMSQCGTTS